MALILPESHHLGGGAMKHDWRTTRRLQPHPDGQRRWDRAYQLILEWAAANTEPGHPSADGLAPSSLMKEITCENCDLCTSLDTVPGADANHRPADRQAAGAHRGPRLATARGKRLP